jgi:hypothetical protein
MQKAMFLLESYKKGILSELDAGYILTVNVPNVDDVQRKLDPYRIEMVSYNGMKSIHPIEGGLKFISTGRKFLCLIEPVNYPGYFVEPAMRSKRSTENIPFRFKECNIYLTFDNKFRILMPDKPVMCYDSFTIEFPSVGDICVLYFIFNDNIDDVVLPYIGNNFEMILKSVVNLKSYIAHQISKDFMQTVKQFHGSV